MEDQIREITEVYFVGRENAGEELVMDLMKVIKERTKCDWCDKK